MTRAPIRDFAARRIDSPHIWYSLTNQMEKSVKKHFSRTRRRMAELSTAHLTASDNDILSNGDFGIMVAKFQYGYVVSVPPKDGQRGSLKSLRAVGLSDTFRTYLRTARDEGLDFLMFDAAAPELSGLPTFSW